MHAKNREQSICNINGWELFGGTAWGNFVARHRIVSKYLFPHSVGTSCIGTLHLSCGFPTCWQRSRTARSARLVESNLMSKTLGGGRLCSFPHPGDLATLHETAGASPFSIFLALAVHQTLCFACPNTPETIGNRDAFPCESLFANTTQL